MDYLWLRAATYWFSLRIPVRHRASYGSVHLRVRIGRVDAIEARRRAQALATHAGLGMESGMERDVLMRSLSALSAELEELRRDRMSAGIRMLNSRGNAAEAALDHDAEMVERWSDAAAKQETRVGEIDRVRQRLERLGQALDADGMAWEGERRAYERAVASASSVAIEAKAALLAAQAQVTSTSPPRPEHRPPGPEEVSDDQAVTRDTLLSVAAWPVVEARCAALSADKGNRYADHVRLSLQSFLEIVGDKPLRRYLPADIQSYANLMARVPVNLPKLSVFRGMTFREAADANAARLTPFDCMRSSTIDKYLTEVKGIWQRATATVADVRDIGAASVTMPRNAAEPLDREGLSSAEISKWLAVAAKHREPEFRWLPVVALLTGMRLSEIVYLQAADFVEFEGHQVIDLRRFVSDGRPLKTKTSRRIVPIHAMMKQIGFVAWVEGNAGKQWLFPSYHEAKDPADAAQKRMTHWMKTIGVHAKTVKTFHSLRHNAKAWLRDIADERIADLVQEHAMKTVGRKYSGRLTPKEVVGVMEGAPPKNVDFSPYNEKIVLRQRPRRRRSANDSRDAAKGAATTET